MDAEKLAHQVLELLDLNELAAVRALLDEVLIRYPAQRAKLVELRDAARTHEGVWQTMRAAAEIAPLAIAISIHAHGRLLNANGDKELSSPLLGIARDAYILAEDPYGAARARHPWPTRSTLLASIVSRWTKPTRRPVFLPSRDITLNMGSAG